MIISLIPGVTSIPPALIVLPVIFIICVNMLREGGEDFLRFLNDRKVNQANTLVLREEQFVKIETGKVRVGDIVQVDQGQIFPADLILIGSSQEDSCCKIETSNLDGETSLKSRFPPTLSKLFNNVASLKGLGGIIKCQEPNESLNKFIGSITVDGHEQVPLFHQNLLLKGCKLSTEIAYGIVIYTGKDTKSLKNMNRTSVKFSLVNKMLNIMVGIMFGIQMICCLSFTAVKSYYEFRERTEFYLGNRERTISDGSFVVLAFLSHIIMFAHLIPVSLLVSFELVKMVQAWFISMDNELVAFSNLIEEPEKKQLVSSVAISSDLNCDLAKIDMIFSDKTGTLTENSMIFKKCCAGLDLIFDDMLERGSIGEWVRNNLQNSYQDQLFLVMNTLLSMSLCHNVSLRKIRKDNEDEVFYEGESIDEVALVLGAMNNQFELKYFSEKKTILSIFGKEYSFERIAEIPFSPKRKRMSTLFKLSLEFLNDFPIYYHIATEKYGIAPDESGQLVICFSKGADSFLYPLLATKNFEENYEKINVQSSQFASEGLRTLLFCFKFVDSNEAINWLTNYNSVQSFISKSRKEAIENCESQLEKDLEIVGCTAVEDTLQDQVPETISFLIEAGIHVWMLTGDKRETAFKIAGIAGLIHEHSQVFTLDGDLGSITSNEEGDVKVCEILTLIQSLSSENQKEIVLVLDGHAFTFCSSSRNFESLVSKCKTVVFCRSTPKQKSQLVHFAKIKLGKRILSIGDGINDVPMIQQANVGVGIIGKEGNQAKMSSDFAIPKFRMLKRLLVVHGRYSYKRIADFIHYYIYINLGIVFIQIIYAFFVQFSGQSLNEDFVTILSTLFFMQLNPLSFGIFEKDISEKYLEDAKHGPILYKLLRKENIFNLYTFVKWIGGGMLHMTIIFFLCMYSTDSCLFTNGKDDGFWVKVVLVTSCSFLVVHLKSFLEFQFVRLHHFTFLQFLFVWALSMDSIGYMLVKLHLYFRFGLNLPNLHYSGLFTCCVSCRVLELILLSIPLNKFSFQTIINSLKELPL
ncbi:predicted protein [Naegleria gruberi]|uniref:Phospholipid-transporting ATPase n=1 Tax=Naegleria gruberi TaxID=5762 RepID=D2VXG7_NAEGR|nr:uncharacterized protein NAEGRDRAFT_73741 [Naegleria gruberi]EFC38504.1 predicted protein [Naegleria gruberi]|eukprot:XP_002671248.1 predicted protein [Naegleria gruberi strain NEG-M]